MSLFLLRRCDGCGREQAIQLGMVQQNHGTAESIGETMRRMTSTYGWEASSGHDTCPFCRGSFRDPDPKEPVN